MGPAVANVLPLALGVLASPLAVFAVILLLGASSGRAPGLSFIGGWVGALLALGLLGILVLNRISLPGGASSATWPRVIKVVIGVALLALAAQQWSDRPRHGREPELPGWLTAIVSAGPVKAAGLGATFAAVKPKNLLLTVGAAAAIGESGLALEQEVVVLLVFVVVASLGVLAPLVIVLTLGDRASGVLSTWVAWLTQHNAVLVATVLLVLGVVLVVQGAFGW